MQYEINLEIMASLKIDKTKIYNSDLSYLKKKLQVTSEEPRIWMIPKFTT